MAGKFKPNNFITLSLLLKFVKRIQTLDLEKDYCEKDCKTIGSGAAALASMAPAARENWKLSRSLVAPLNPLSSGRFPGGDHKGQKVHCWQT